MTSYWIHLRTFPSQNMGILFKIPKTCKFHRGWRKWQKSKKGQELQHRWIGWVNLRAGSGHYRITGYSRIVPNAHAMSWLLQKSPQHNWSQGFQQFHRAVKLREQTFPKLLRNITKELAASDGLYELPKEETLADNGCQSEGRVAIGASSPPCCCTRSSDIAARLSVTYMANKKAIAIVITITCQPRMRHISMVFPIPSFITRRGCRQFDKKVDQTSYQSQIFCLRPTAVCASFRCFSSLSHTNHLHARDLKSHSCHV